MITFSQTASSSPPPPSPTHPPLWLSFLLSLPLLCVSSRWSWSSECNDRSFHTDWAGRPALRQQDLFDAGIPPREWNLGSADLLLYHPFRAIRSFIHIRLCITEFTSSYTHSHLPLKTLSAESQGHVCISGPKSFISLALALISILRGTN